MGSRASQGRSRHEHPRFTTNAELHGLERMRAPWFFETEVQRRMRTAGVSHRSARLRRLRIVALSAVLTAGAAYAVMEYGERLYDLLPEQSTPAVGPSGVETPADTTRRVAPQADRETARPVPASPQQRTQQRTLETAVPGQETDPPVATDTVSGTNPDTIPRTIPVGIPDTARPEILSPREEVPADTLPRRESRPAMRPADSTTVRPDTLRGTP